MAVQFVFGVLLRLVSDLPRPVKRSFIVALDVLLLPVAMFFALALQQSRFPHTAGMTQLWLSMIILMTLAGLLSVTMGLHKVQLKAYETRALGMTALHALVVGVASALLGQLSGSGSPL